MFRLLETISVDLFGCFQVSKMSVPVTSTVNDPPQLVDVVQLTVNNLSQSELSRYPVEYLELSILYLCPSAFPDDCLTPAKRE